MRVAPACSMLLTGLIAACGDVPTELPMPTEGAETGTGPVTAVAPLALSVTNVAVPTGEAYKVLPNGMAPNAVQYIDRSYQFTDPMPAELRGLTYIQTANDDKDAAPGSSTFLTFDVNQDVTVYVAHDDRLSSRPSWLSSYTNTGLKLRANDDAKSMTVFRRSAPKGKVTLGSNVQQPGQRSMYTVLLAATGGGGGTTPGAPTVDITAPTAGATLKGAVTVTANATDDEGVAGVQFLVGSVPIGSEELSPPYSVSWNTSGVADGSHVLRAVARDAGGRSTADSISVSVANGTGGPLPGTRVGHYVTSSGTASGDGTQARPWNLETALAHPARVAPGDTIWVRGGTYRGCFSGRLSGTAGQPIVLRQFPGERAVLDGAGCNAPVLALRGAHAYYWGFEVMKSSPGTAGIGVDARGTELKLINLVVHDAGQSGVGMWSDGPGGEVYGSIIYNNGRNNNLDHGVYSQNRTGQKRIIDNVIFHQWAYGIHVYGSSAAGLVDYLIEGNAVFGNGAISPQRAAPNLLVGGGSPAARITVRNNYIYHNRHSSGNVWMGFEVANQDLVFRDNYIAGGFTALRLWRWASGTVSGNTIYTPDYYPINSLASLGGFSWSGNTWHRDPALRAWSHDNSAQTWAAWKSATGKGGTDAMGSSRPSGTRVFVRPNRYEPGRGHVIVYNWAGAGSVSVDLSQVVRPGDRYEVRAVQRLGTPLVSGTYGGGSVTLPLSAVASPAPIGGGTTPSAVGPEFTVFLVTSPTRS